MQDDDRLIDTLRDILRRVRGKGLQRAADHASDSEQNPQVSINHSWETRLKDAVLNEGKRVESGLHIRRARLRSFGELI